MGYTRSIFIKVHQKQPIEIDAKQIELDCTRNLGWRAVESLCNNNAGESHYQIEFGIHYRLFSYENAFLPKCILILAQHYTKSPMAVDQNDSFVIQTTQSNPRRFN